MPERAAIAWPLGGWRDVNAAVAVSGGADSVALLRALVHLKREAGGRGALVVIHYDHGARGAESAADAAWVERLARKLDLACLVETAEGAAATSEEGFRDARRAFYRRAAGECGARWLATGHTADDQAETVLFRALRGAGLRGLAGIPSQSVLTDACSIVRPLLGVTRADVLAYLDAISQPYREDATNASSAYTRNWLRSEVLPTLNERVPGCANNLRRLADQAGRAAETLETLAAETLESAATPGSTPGAWWIDRGAMQAAPALLATEALRLLWRRNGWPEQAMTAAAWDRLAELSRSDDAWPAELFPGAIRVERTPDGALLAPPEGTLASGGSC